MIMIHGSMNLFVEWYSEGTREILITQLDGNILNCSRPVEWNINKGHTKEIKPGGLIANWSHYIEQVYLGYKHNISQQCGRRSSRYIKGKG